MGFDSKPLLLFLFMSCFSVTHGASSCGKKLSDITYPFKLEHQKPGNNCTYFDLTCDKPQGKASVNLPYSGEFYVEYIDYNSRYIQLSDPGNCLMKRLMNFSMLASSPYKVEYGHYKYVLYVCPRESKALNSSNPIVCLSNSTSATIATNEFSRSVMESSGCVEIGSLLIPTLNTTRTLDPANQTSFYLTWDDVSCEESESDESGDDDDQRKPLSKILAVVSTLPILIVIPVSCISMFCLHVIRILTAKQESVPPELLPEERRNIHTPQVTMMMPRPSTTTNNGLDESRIMACTEITVLDESDGKFMSGGNNACSICLENYCKEDRVRVIIKCEHLFHDECIQVWLGKNGTCPVCRTSLSEAALEHRNSVALS